MRHFPIYLDTKGKTIVVSGGGECAVAKLRLLLKTEATIKVFSKNPGPEILNWARDGRLSVVQHPLSMAELHDVSLLYAANDDPVLDAHIARLGREAGVKTLVVDNLEASDFITPAIVDRAPVIVAIGTEGTAPVLARKIKSEIEASLPTSLGKLARVGQAFRGMAAKLPGGRTRREFWSKFYYSVGPKAIVDGEEAATKALEQLHTEFTEQKAASGHVHFVGAGPGDPELLTLKSRKALHEADFVIYDRLVSPEILELARREATLIEVGKTPFGRSWKQEDINALLVQHGQSAVVVRLKSGDPGVFGRLDEETDALDAAGIDYSVLPGITSAVAAAAELKVSLTKRGRNSATQIITGYDVNGYSDQDWRALATPGAVAAIYMGKTAANFLRGRLLMHGASPLTPVSIVEKVSRLDQRIIPTTLLGLQDSLSGVTGPAVLMLGLEPKAIRNSQLKEVL